MEKKNLRADSLLLQNASYSGALKQHGDPNFPASGTDKYGVIHYGFLHVFDDVNSEVPTSSLPLVNMSFSECPKEHPILNTKWSFYLETSDKSATKYYFSVGSETEVQKWMTVLSNEKRKLYANLIRTPPDGNSFTCDEFLERKDTNSNDNNFIEAREPCNQPTRGRSLTAMEHRKGGQQLGVPRRHSSPTVSPGRKKNSAIAKFTTLFKKNSSPESSPKLDRRESIPKIQVSMSEGCRNVYDAVPTFPPNPCDYFSTGYAAISQIHPRRVSAPFTEVTTKEHAQLQRHHSAAMAASQPPPTHSTRVLQQRRQSTPVIPIISLRDVSYPVSTPPRSPRVPTSPRPCMTVPHNKTTGVSPGSRRRYSLLDVPQPERMLPCYSTVHAIPDIPRRSSSPSLRSSPEPSPLPCRAFNFIGADGRILSSTGSRRPTDGAEQPCFEVEDYVSMNSVEFVEEERAVHTTLKTNLHMTSPEFDKKEDLYVVPETEGDLESHLPASVYQWGMDRATANKLLLEYGKAGLYVIRTASDEKKVISTFVLGQTRHYKIFQENGHMFLRKDHPLFENIHDLIRYYRNYDLPTCRGRLTQPYR